MARRTVEQTLQQEGVVVTLVTPSRDDHQRHEQTQAFVDRSFSNGDENRHYESSDHYCMTEDEWIELLLEVED